MADIPYINPNVKYVGVSYLRQMNSKRLKALTHPMVVEDSCKPVAVIVPFDLFMNMQGALEQAGVI